ncbi:VIT domain-containing protein [Pseudoduganella aquatica]|uniref:VIT domain-containing protein n=1 Tax=Pseudoduganella aquatica TaxID=2660641 RepID=UPI001E4E84B5|nr:VIT domain-containing protein [Pseudoduganella aquatica]
MLLRLLVLLLMLCALPCGAGAAVPMPRMETLNGERPVRLQSVSIAGAVSGGMAETTVRMVFFNPNGRALEGHLHFPLLEGQQISAFALDIDGKLRPAVPVEKSRGREILEAVERRGIDPGLLERTEGNHFRLRVYPIPAQGTRTVEVKYSETLARDGTGWIYRLPLAYGERVRDFGLSLQVNGASAAPSTSGALGELHFEGMRNGYRAQVAKQDYTGAANAALALRLPGSAQPQAYVQQFDGERYFVAEIPVAARRVARTLPKVVGLLWDSSGSGANRHIDAELAELDRYFKALGRAEVRLQRLRDRPEAAVAYQIERGNWSALRKDLLSTVYDGASALADWQPQRGVDEYLLVSDGLLNYGGAKFPVLASGQRLYAMNSAASADTGRLAALAERSGGQLVQVQADRPGAAAEMLLTDGPQLHDLHADGAKDLLADLSGARQGMLRVAGKLTQPSAQVALTIVQQGKATEIKLAVGEKAPLHPQAALVWAGYKLRELEAEFDLHRGAIRRLGAQFGLPTRETSLLVLERLDDYVRYDVTPPAELLADYEKMKARFGAQLAQRRVKQLDDVVRRFQQKEAWWNKDYPKEAAAKLAQVLPRTDSGAGLGPIKVTGSSVGPLRDVVVAEDIGAAPGNVIANATNAARRASAPLAFERAPEVPAPAPVSPRPPPPPAPFSAPAPALAYAPAQTSAPASATPQAGTAGAGTISMKKWSANAPYIARMKAASSDALYAIYLDERPSWSGSSAFYLDVADMLIERGQRDLGLRVLSNLAELELENRHVLRILGYRLLQAGLPQLAVPLFEQVLLLAGEEPQSYRDLGLAYAAAGKPQQAVDQLYEVVLRPWDGRFADIELIALAEMNAIIAAAPKGTVDTGRIDGRLLKNLPLDLRAVLTWDADNSDMDLWVTDPNGERCYYAQMITAQGGRISRDFTGGYGPEEFSLRKAKPGKYQVHANFFGHRQQLVAGATTVQLRLTTAFGTPDAKEEMVTVRLSGRGSTVLVGEFEVPGS